MYIGLDEVRIECAMRVMCVMLGPSWGAIEKDALVDRAFGYADEFVKHIKEENKK